MLIGVLKEVLPYESRVAITTDIVKKLISGNHKVCIEKNAGAKSFQSDIDFTNAGASVVENVNDIYNADIIFKVNPPTKDELELIKEETKIITFFQIKDRKRCII